MNEKLDPDDKILDELYKKIDEIKNKQLDDKHNYDTYSK